MAFEIGAQIGPYKITELLGQGGMATVYKGYHEALDRYVAIKALNPALLDDQNFSKRFQREARVIAKLEHPNIVPVYDYSEHEGRPYLVMKIITGVTLKDRIKAGDLSKDEITMVIKSVGAALSYAHEQGVLHRDIKPSNVLLSDDNQVYLADFGLARLVHSGESTLTSDRILGTPKYISPEQAMSKPELDARADVYSFGAMVYELVVGRVPFLADTPFTIIHDHIYTPLPSPKEVNPDISDEIAIVLTKALEKKPENRYSSAEAFVNEFIFMYSMEETEGAVDDVSQPNDAEETLVSSDVLASAPLEEKVSVEPEDKPKKEKKRKLNKKSCLWIALSLIAAVVLVFGCLAVFGGILEKLEEPTMLQESDNDVYQEANYLLEEAYYYMVDGDYPAMEEMLQEAYDLVAQDREYYLDTMRYLEENEEYLFATLVGLSLVKDMQIEEMDAETLEKIHELLYKAARDERAEPFMFEKEDRFAIVGRIAALRYHLYHGESPDIIRRELIDVLDSPLLMRRFPEAKLLQVEINIMINDYGQAQELADEMFSQAPGKIPEWIIIELDRIVSEELN